MNTRERIISVSIFLFISISSVTFILAIFAPNIRDLLILNNNTPINMYIKIFMSATSLSLQTILITSHSLKNIKTVHVVISIFYCFAIQFLSFIVPYEYSFVFTSIIPTFAILAIGAYRVDIKQTIYRFMHINIMFIAIQILTSFIKSGEIILVNSYNIPTEPKIMACIDYAIYLIIANRGDINGWRTGRLGKLVDFPGEQQSDAGRNESDQPRDEAVEAYLSATGAERVISRLIKYGSQVLQVGVIIAICAFLGTFVVASVQLVSFIAFGFIVKKRWHFNSDKPWKVMAGCTASAVAIFGALSVLMPPFKYSQYIHVVAALALTCLLHRIAIHIDKYKDTRRMLNESIDNHIE